MTGVLGIRKDLMNRMPPTGWCLEEMMHSRHRLFIRRVHSKDNVCGIPFCHSVQYGSMAAIFVAFLQAYVNMIW